MGLDDKKAHRTPRRNLRGLVPRTRRQVQRGRRTRRFWWAIVATPFALITLSGRGMDGIAGMFPPSVAPTTPHSIRCHRE